MLVADSWASRLSPEGETEKTFLARRALHDIGQTPFWQSLVACQCTRKQKEKELRSEKT